MSYDNEKMDGGSTLKAALRYFETLFGLPVRQASWTGASELPLYLANQYRCIRVSLESADFLIAEPVGEVPTPATLEKHIAALRDRYKGPVGVLLASIEPVARSRLLARHVPFIVPGQQLYFPELGLALRERGSRIVTASELVSPSAQNLVVMLLMGLVPKTARVTEIANAMGYTAMTASRILSALEARDIVVCAKEGRARRLLAPDSRRGLWERARPFMATPVLRTLYLADVKPPTEALEAGYLALSRMSDLAEPTRRDYAIDPDVAARLLKNKRLVRTDSGEDAEARVQVWAYKPIPASNERWVNPFSLYLSLSKDEDERIRKALDSLLEAQWSKE